jgi:type I pantothenate kinase
MTDELTHLAAEIVSSEDRPTIVGVSGAVAVGKTAIAGALADRVAARSTTVQVISTDAFLFPNDVLAERDLQMRKGFPESYDFGALLSAIADIRRGAPIDIPVYSHATYDIVRDAREPVDAVDVLVVEGVVALQPPVREALDVAVYVDAAEDIVQGWFVDRFLRFVADARDDEASFYHGFAALEDAQVRAIADATWDGINAVNLREHIAPSGSTADVVVTKGPDHTVLSVRRSA